jgi:hypothetical protein
MVCDSGLPKGGIGRTYFWFRNVVLSWFNSNRLQFVLFFILDDFREEPMHFTLVPCESIGSIF